MPRFRSVYIALTTAYCAGIFFLSSQPHIEDEAPRWLDFPGSDKIAHLVLYAGLAFLVYAGLIRSNAELSTRARVLIPILFATLYGVSDEIHQLFVPNRSFDLFDLLADGAGATILVVAIELRRRRRGATAGTLAR